MDERELLRLSHVQTGKYFRASALAFSIFDYYLTLDQEVKILWKAKLSLSQLCCITARYFAILSSTFALATQLVDAPRTAPDCAAVRWLGNLFAGLSVDSAEVILILRTYAIYDNSKSVLGAVFFVYTACAASGLSIVIKDAKTPSSARYVNGLPPRCDGPLFIHLYYLEFVFILIFETFIAILTFHRWLKFYRQSTSPFVAALHRDGLLYYLFLCGITLANIVTKLTLEEEYNDLLAIFQPVLHSAFAARILFRIRSWKVNDTGASSEATPLTAIRFDQGPRGEVSSGSGYTSTTANSQIPPSLTAH